MGGHGHAMGCPGLRGTAEQIDAVGRRCMGSTTCMSPTVGHMQCKGACNQRKAAHRRAQAAHRSEQAAQGSAPVVHRRVQAGQGQCADSVQAVRIGYMDTVQ